MKELKTITNKALSTKMSSAKNFLNIMPTIDQIRFGKTGGDRLKALASLITMK